MASSASQCLKKQSPSTEVHEAKTYVEGPKSAKLGHFLTDISHHFDVGLTITNIDKGWLNETVYFTITGTKSEILRLNDAIKITFARHNAGLR
jgi:hypothetical protein